VPLGRPKRSCGAATKVGHEALKENASADRRARYGSHCRAMKEVGSISEARELGRQIAPTGSLPASGSAADVPADVENDE
jgi:hypothetical protein